MKLRKYQKECLQAMFKDAKGRIILPTGSGKSYIALEHISTRIQKYGAKVSVVFVPRIMLAKQWLIKAATVLIKNKGLNVNFINLNSGGVSQQITNEIEKCLYEHGLPVVPIESSTDSQKIKSKVNFLMYNKKCDHVVIFCTYHSWQVLATANLFIDTIIYDECHYLVASNDFFGCLDISSDYKYPMTATQRFTDSDDGKGMNNKDAFGPIIFEKKPIELIKTGAILAPRVHIVGINGIIKPRAYNDWSELIYNSFLKHKKHIKDISSEPDKIGAKVLILCNGQLNLQGIFESSRFKEIRKENPNLKIFGLCSDFGIEYDGTYYSPPVSASMKEEFLSSVSSLDDNDDALIFHIDMIGEGLDVPGITGVMFLRNTGIIKSLQNLGRGTRLHHLDSKRIENKELAVEDYVNYIKPYCHVILPYCTTDSDDFLERNVNLLEALRSDYGFDPSEHIIIDNISPGQEGPKFEEDEIKRQIRGIVTNQITQFYHEIEEGQWSGEQLLFRYHFNTLSQDGIAKIIRNLAEG